MADKVIVNRSGAVVPADASPEDVRKAFAAVRKAGKAERAREALHRQARAIVGAAVAEAARTVPAPARPTRAAVHTRARRKPTHPSCKRALKDGAVHACGWCDGTPAFWNRVALANPRVWREWNV